MARTIPINEFSVPNAGQNDLISAAGFNPVFGAAGKLTLYANGDAVGLTHSLAVDDGTESHLLIPSGGGLSAASTTGKIKTNEDFIGQWAIPAGIKLIWNIVNGSGAAIKMNALLQIE